MTAVEDPNELGTLPLFQGLSQEELVRLNSALRRSVVPAGTRVISAQQVGEAMYVILSGAVKVQVDREDGTEVTLALLGPGDTVGEMSLIDQSTRSANVVTVEETTFAWMDRATFHECLEGMSSLNQNLVRQLSSRLRQANQQIQALSTLDVRGRIARQLLHFAELYGKQREDGGVSIPLPLTQSDVAEMVGATRERVNQVMVVWKRDGVIAVDPRHHITIYRPDALAEHCR